MFGRKHKRVLFDLDTVPFLDFMID